MIIHGLKFCKNSVKCLFIKHLSSIQTKSNNLLNRNCLLKQLQLLNSFPLAPTKNQNLKSFSLMKFPLKNSKAKLVIFLKITLEAYPMLNNSKFIPLIV